MIRPTLRPVVTTTSRPSRVYLDHAAGTPMRPEAIEAMAAELARTGNASSLHGSGRAARAAVEDARERIADAVGADPVEVVFTSGGTEADNLAVKGSAWSGASRGRDVLLGSTVEHHAVLDPLGWLADGGTPVEWVGVDRDGRLDLDHLASLLERSADRAALVTAMWANNEVGTLTPVDEVAELAHRYGAVAHADAVQALGHVPLDFAASGLDALTISAHKLGGPVGTGALIAKRDLALVPVQHGGGQERDVRSGTLDVAAVVGFAVAVEVAVADVASSAVRLRGLRDQLVADALETVPGTSVNSTPDGLPGLANLTFEGADADAVLMLLDEVGIDCSVGSACSAGVSQTSHVLLAMGRTPEQAGCSLRFSLGHTSTGADVDALRAALPRAVATARSIAPR